MRDDALGMFWRDEPVIKIKKEKPVRNPPERTWELPTYLPFLDEARAFQVKLYDDDSLIQAAIRREKVVFDIESYPNYFVAAFRGEDSERVVYFEILGEQASLDASCIHKLNWIVHNFQLISFNGMNYDIPILALALNGATCHTLKFATDLLIVGDETGPKRPYEVLRKFKTKQLKGIDHVDLIEVAPLDASLKIYSGRLHCQRVQDLPYRPDTVLNKEQTLIVRWYCVNDLVNTSLLYRSLSEAIGLRADMGKVYGVDLRSKSDAQIAEAVISSELERITGQRPQRPATMQFGTVYRYEIPHFLRFNTVNMQWVLQTVRNALFIVGEEGRIEMPKTLANLDIPLGAGIYRMGIGGLHSSETTICHKADENTILSDRDVASYYPRILLNLGLYPSHLGPTFLVVYESIVNRRLEAKSSGDKLTAETLKITVNGSFGKTGNKYSILYEPSMVIQITITGQLCLLMLIERLELAGIPVVSANTDGVVIKCPKSREQDMDSIIKAWEVDTGFETEENRYKALYSRDVNNYIAVKMDDKVKLKGAYSEVDLWKNPQNEVCVEAVIQLLTKGVPVAVTINACRDITKFLSLRKVRGGAVKDGVFLGSTVRWYYARAEEGMIVYAKTGNKVPRSDGAKPLQDLPAAFPDDVDQEWYIAEAYEILRDVGYMI